MSSFSRQLLFLSLCIIALSGCAGRPWTEPLEENDFKSVVQQVESLKVRDDSCGKVLTTDVAIFYTSPLTSRAFSGYLQSNADGLFKFVSTNPFGQPIFAAAGNRSSFQSIITMEKRYLAGSLRSFALHNDIPLHFVEANWWEWLTARVVFSGKEISMIRRDGENRGVWLSYEQSTTGGQSSSHLLVNLANGKAVSRIVENVDGEIVATITYDKWLTLSECPQPTEITINGLDYGTDIRLQLSEPTLNDDGASDYRLPLPAGYTRQFMP